MQFIIKNCWNHAGLSSTRQIWLWLTLSYFANDWRGHFDFILGSLFLRVVELAHELFSGVLESKVLQIERLILVFPFDAVLLLELVPIVMEVLHEIRLKS